jgi:hypothetical protein
MKVDGRCHCGAISFEAEIEQLTAGMCHCEDCQRLTGSAFRANVQAKAETFRLRGEPSIYIKTADSGNKRAHAFCGRCGTPIYACAPVDPTSYSLRLGTLTQRHKIVPQRQIYTKRAMKWLERLDAIEAFGGPR